SWRERPLSSYSIKVKILSQLQSSTCFSDGKYQFRRFFSGGYNWRMIIYPKGNENDNGSGTSLMFTQPMEVFADIRFFVFNKQKNKYFTIQTVQFNTLRTMWGLPQVLPLDTFNDHKNGYIFDGDHCEFATMISFGHKLNYPTKWEIISFGHKLPFLKFSWIVKNFSQPTENPYASSNFSMGGKNWILKLYPKDYSTEDGKWLSIYLFLADGEVLKEDEKIYVQADLKVEDPRGSDHLIKERML
ncbi:hypothetical protein EUTSA_v10029340mg, partial [Eutrema salsugineum]